MSNHMGSFLINDLLTEMLELGFFNDIDETRRKALVSKLWQLNFDYDCNWGEIITPVIAKALNVCAECGQTAHNIDEEGFCIDCHTNNNIAI